MLFRSRNCSEATILSTAEKLFDQYAGNYELALSNALAPSGESREYFAEGRVEELNAIVHPAVIARQAELSEAIFARDPEAVVIV